jgi:hypothetical protein
MSHHCHVPHCEVPIPPRLLMCLTHWRLVPKPLQRAVLSTYRPGQEREKNPSEPYLHAARAAIEAVARAEYGCQWHNGWTSINQYPYSCDRCGKLLSQKRCEACGSLFLHWGGQCYDDIVAAPSTITMSGDILCVRCGY